jgi:hypothetical protein
LLNTVGGIAELLKDCVPWSNIWRVLSSLQNFDDSVLTTECANGKIFARDSKAF